MQELTYFEIENVSGGCEEHCWGDFSFAGFMASVGAGAIGGIGAGWAGAALGGLSGGLGYAGGKIGDKMSERTTSTSDE
ncbi:hypothetical protein FJN13_13260 [Alteromonas mediterranea]|uniref:Bacteriocin n=1 Tax=Alteromonas mediterranea TaxID=314275 RepID=A0AAC9JBI6_9ALTE|nr:hypothetical protein [Alteromonas mediterranea]APD90655.1 hypothetical protein BM524_13065 [Alteromonas mediterranea]QDG35708.1 hypothetical protein FJN13_13260 [Alteromonas mediterranea]